MKTALLYKRTSTGAIQQWQQELVGNKYRTISGQLDGKLVTSEWTVCESKNVGRSNETSPMEQAELEVESNCRKKLEQGGYHENINDIDKPKYFKPMLAKKYEDYVPTEADFKNEIVFTQPKLDGIRGILTAEGLFSRTGKKLVATPHIENLLKPFFRRFPDAILDGELYADKFKDNFNDLMSLVRKTKPTSADLEQSAAQVQYWIYDYPSVNGGFGDRFVELYNVFKWAMMIPNHEVGRDVFVLVPTSLAPDKDMLDNYYSDYLANNLEGQIVRIDGSDYENKRTNKLLKRKEFQDNEFTIVDIEEGDGNRSGMAGNIKYTTDSGIIFDSNIRGDREFYKQLLEEKHRYIGGVGTVRYFHMTPDGKPRFPVTVSVFDKNRDV